MYAFPRSLHLLASAGVTFSLSGTLIGCGDDGNAEAPLAVEAASTLAQDTPPPAVAPGVLGATADVDAAQRRLGYVNPKALAALGGPLPADTIAKLVLGASAAARLESADPQPDAVVQVGPATVVATAGARTIQGGSAELQDRLEDPAPTTSLITAETPSAVQSCLGDPAAEVIVGPAVLGRMSAAGASVLDTDDAPAGPKLLLCFAPHFARDLHAIEDRLKARFPAKDAPAGEAPIVAEQEIGEREIVGATIALKQVDPVLLRELLAGGPALVRLVQG